MIADNFYHDDNGNTREITEHERALGMNSHGVFTKPGETIRLCQSGKVRCTITLATLPDGTTFAGYDHNANWENGGGAPNVRYPHLTRQAAIDSEVKSAREWLASFMDFDRHKNAVSARTCLAQLNAKYPNPACSHDFAIQYEGLTLCKHCHVEKPQPLSKMKTKMKTKTKPSPDTSTHKPKAPKPWDLARDYHPASAVSFFDDALDPDNAAKNRPASITPEGIADVALRGIQQPVWYRIKDGKPRLIAGERRVLMARAAALLTIPTFDYGKLSDTQAAQLANIENCQRENLTDTERAQAYARLVKHSGFKWWDEANPAASVGHAFGISKSAAYEWQAIASLDPLAAQALASGELKKSIAIRLSRIFITEQRTTATARAIRDQWTDAEASEIIATQYMAVIPAHIDRTDATYKCGIACDKCPHNSGAQADFIGGRGDLCAKLDCLAEKLDEAHGRKAKTWPGILWTQKQAIAAGLRKDEWSGANSLSADYCNLDSTAEFYRIPGYKPKKKTIRGNLGDDLSKKEIILTITNDGKNTSLEIIPLALAKKLLQKRGHIKAPVEKTPSSADKEREAKQARANAIRDEIARLIVASAEEMAVRLKLKPDDHMLELHSIAIALYIECIGTWKLEKIITRRQAEKTGLALLGRESLTRLIADKTRCKPPELLGFLAEIYTMPDCIRDEVRPEDYYAEDFIHWLELDIHTLIDTATATIDAKGAR